jgi:hypothetical protein
VAPGVNTEGDPGYIATPSQDEPVSWQLAHPLVTPEWIMTPVGAGDWNKVPGTVRTAFAGTAALGLLAKWQFSQLLLLTDGMCEFAPGEPDGGCTMMLLMP